MFAVRLKSFLGFFVCAFLFFYLSPEEFDQAVLGSQLLPCIPASIDWRAREALCSALNAGLPVDHLHSLQAVLHSLVLLLQGPHIGTETPWLSRASLGAGRESGQDSLSWGPRSFSGGSGGSTGADA